MKITIEHQGLKVVMDEKEFTDRFSFSLGTTTREVPCDCPAGDCGYVHRALAPGGRLRLDADLKALPLWTEV